MSKGTKLVVGSNADFDLPVFERNRSADKGSLSLPAMLTLNLNNAIKPRG